MALTEKLGNIADAIRGKTGKTDAMTLDQMVTEIEGISGGGNGLAYDMGEFVLDADTYYLETHKGITHELGEVPDFILIWTDAFADLNSENLSPYSNGTACGYCFFNGLAGMVQRLSSANSTDFAIAVGFTLLANDYRIGAASGTAETYHMHATYLPTETKLGLYRNVNNYYRAGVTYKYFVSKAWWNVGGVANAE